MPQKMVHVAVGIILNCAGEVLISRRPCNVHQGGLWEFPGGKLESQEDAGTALSRELKEELGLIVEAARPLMVLHYDYPDRRVKLHVWMVNKWQGMPRSREGQPLVWARIGSLAEYAFPAADERIIKALQLPSLYLLTPEPGERSIDNYLSIIEDCIKAGARLLQLRCKEATYRKNPELITQILALCNSHNTLLLLNSTPAMAVSFNAHGVHLNSSRLMQLNHRPLDKHYWIAASCHNRTELMQACNIDADFIVLSPVRETTTHPEAQPLGWEKFSELLHDANIPVYALGGMQPYHLPHVRTCGAQGIAILSAIWSNSRPADVVRRCVNMQSTDLNEYPDLNMR